MKTRLIKNYVTTVLGVVAFGIAVWQWIEGKPQIEVAMVAGYGFMFLRSKDSLIGLPAKDDGEK